jgi:hypothetical protein
MNQEGRMRMKTSGRRTQRSGYFLAGLLAGAVSVAVYTVSCNTVAPAKSGTGTTAAPPASDVPYTNAQSGLGATTVQGAIDEIGTTMRSATAGIGAVTGGGATSTTWTLEMQLLDPATETLASKSLGTLTLTETAAGQGSYETSGANIFLLDGLTGAPGGTRVGKYFVVDDLVLVTGEVPVGNKSGMTWLARLADGGRRLTLSNFGAVVLVMTRQ